MKKIVSIICNAILIIAIPAIFIGYLNDTNIRAFNQTSLQKDIFVPVNNLVKAPVMVYFLSKNKG